MTDFLILLGVVYVTIGTTLACVLALHQRKIQPLGLALMLFGWPLFLAYGAML